MKVKMLIVGAGVGFLILSAIASLVLFQSLSAKIFTPLYNIRLAYAEPLQSAFIFDTEKKHAFESGLAILRLTEVEEAMQNTLIEANDAVRTVDSFNAHAKKSYLLLIKLAEKKQYVRVAALAGLDEQLIVAHGRVLSRLVAASTDPTEREAVNFIVQATVNRYNEVSRYRKSMETRLKNDAKLITEADARAQADEALSTQAKLNAAKTRLDQSSETYQKAFASVLASIEKTKTALDEALKKQAWGEAFVQASSIIRSGELALTTLKAEIEYKVNTSSALTEPLAP